jgi:hypothetical protein
VRRRPWREATPGLRAVVVVAAVLGSIVIASVAVDRSVRGRDRVGAGSRGSVRSTAADGTKAFRELLDEFGHPTRDLAGAVPADLAPDTTLFVLAPDGVDGRSARHVRAFVRAGGRAVITGDVGPAWLGTDRPVVGSGGGRRARARVDGRVHDVTVDGTGVWRTPAGHRVVVVRRIGAGRAYLVSTDRPLANERLGAAENAAFGLALAGAGRPVAFAEGIHGLTATSGFAALPLGWRVALIGIPFALLLAAIASSRRLGGPEPTGRDLAPARRVAVDAVGDALARAHDAQGALTPLQLRARAGACRRLGLDPDADAATVYAAAVAGGWPADEAAAIVQPPRADALLPLGRAVVRSERGAP